MPLDPNSMLDVHERVVRTLDWNLLRVYIAIVHHGGISRAAERIHLSQPAVSQSLKRLESHLGLRLIERNARKFEITDAGKSVYVKALEIYNQVSRLGETATDQDQVIGTVRLLFASRLKSYALDDLLKQFVNRFPAVILRIDVHQSSDIQVMIQQGVACAGFCLLRGTPSDLKTELFMSQRFGLYCGPSHPFFGRTDLKPSAFRTQDFITFPSDQIGGVLSPLAVYREQHIYEGRVVATSFSLDEIIRLTEIGIGIGLMPRHIAAELVKEGRLWALPPERGIGPIDIHLIWSASSDLSAAEAAFVGFANDYISQIPIKERVSR